MSEDRSTSQRSHITLSAVVYPRCVCGLTWPEHTSNIPCVYVPSRPIEDHGVIAEEGQ